MAGDSNNSGRGADRKALEVNREQLKIFVETLFHHCSDGVVSLRTFAEDDSKPPVIRPISLSCGLQTLIYAAEYHARLAANDPTPKVFCPPIATFRHDANDRAREIDILEAPALSVEIDERPRAGVQRLQQVLGPATLLVRSGGEWRDPETGEVEDKLHIYWRLKKPARDGNIAKLKEARRLATALVGGDTSNITPAHPIRWAGSWHRKSEPRLCEIIESSDNEIDLDEVLLALEAVVPGGPGTSPSSATPARNGNGDPADRQASPEYVAEVVAAIPNPDLPHTRDFWVRMGLAIFAATGGCDEGFSIYDTWSQKSAKYNLKEKTHKRWAGMHRSPPNRIGIGTLEFLAQQANPDFDLEQDLKFLAFVIPPADVSIDAVEVRIIGSLNASESPDRVAVVTPETAGNGSFVAREGGDSVAFHGTIEAPEVTVVEGSSQRQSRLRRNPHHLLLLLRRNLQRYTGTAKVEISTYRGSLRT